MREEVGIGTAQSAIPNRKGFLGVVLCACLSLAVAAAGGEAQERRAPRARDDAATDARMLADLEILRDLELLRQLDLLRKMDDLRSEPPPRGAKSDEKGKP